MWDIGGTYLGLVNEGMGLDLGPTPISKSQRYQVWESQTTLLAIELREARTFPERRAESGDYLKQSGNHLPPVPSGYMHMT